MRVIQLTRFGGPEMLEPTDIPAPRPGPGQVALEVRAAGVNFAETLMREDRYAMPMSLPTVLGSEVAGVVTALGVGVTGPAVGTRIAAPLFAAGVYAGGYAETAVIDARYAVPLPEALAFDTAVALMVQGLTALYLTRQAPAAGKRVLVTAAAGGVGSLLVQLARRAGATQVVAAASSEAKRSFALGLGADAAIDYTQGTWAQAVRDATGGSGADVVYESVGGDICMAAFDALAPLGRMIVYGARHAEGLDLGAARMGRLIFGNQSVTGFALVPLLTAERLQADLAELFSIALDGTLEVPIGGTFPLAEAADAHRALAGRATFGKLVLVP